MVEHNINILQENQFAEVVNIIQQHRCHASYAVNKESLLTAWAVGKYVSGKLKNEEWGSKVVSLLSEYIRAKQPDIKGFSRSSIYNMVMFYDEYSSDAFQKIIEVYLPAKSLSNNELTTWNYSNVKTMDSNKPISEIVQTASGQFTNVLCLTTLSNHYDILSVSVP